MNNTEIRDVLIAQLEEKFFTADQMRKFEHVFVAKIKATGCSLQKNYTLAELSDGRKGRVDWLITAPTGEQCAIEVDNKSPRRRSVLKLSELPNGISGFVLLKDGRVHRRYSVEGVAVVRATPFR
ncbi:hypothetical protein EHW66_21215 [Erwinia psidii]|nr:hypothetical protein [Erwinia psidii]